MKLVYFDESGIDQLDQAPDMIVAGVMIDRDRQHDGLCTYLNEMLEFHTPNGAARPKHFHTKDIFHGKGDFEGPLWENARWPLMEDMAKVPKIWDLPLFCSAIDRAGAAEELNLNERHRDKNCYAIAAVTCILQVEMYMRQHSPHDEGQIIFEKVQYPQQRVRDIFDFLANPDPEFLDEASLNCLPVRRIREKPEIKDKNGSIILQIADFCAFAVRRAMQQASGYERLITPIQDNFVHSNHGYSSVGPAETKSPDQSSSAPNCPQSV